MDGEFRSRNKPTAIAFSRFLGSGLDMRHRLPGLSVGLAASLRSMPTACYESSEVPIRLREQLHACIKKLQFKDKLKLTKFRLQINNK